MCGAAPSLFVDLEEARRLRPDAATLGVKFAASVVPEIEHVWTQHCEMTKQIKDASSRPIRVHARPRASQMNRKFTWHTPEGKEAFDAIDYFWPDLSWAKGSSGVAGAMWARHGMGFDEVIMAGIGLEPGNHKYIQSYPNKYSQGQGYATNAQIEHWLKLLQLHIDDGKTHGVYSMSGKTMQMLGKPC